jgi:peptidoglycan/LPS O-acetylase OafA/YrhL
MKEKFEGVDLLRTIACLSVCLFHFCNLKLPDSLTYLQNDSLLLHASNILWYLVFGFFIISSYILFNSLYYESYRINLFIKFLFRRFVRIYPPFVASIIIFFFIKYLFTINPNYIGDSFKIYSYELIGNLLFCPSIFNGDWYNPVYWTLSIEFQFYILLGLIFPILNYTNFTKRIAVEIIGVLLVFVTVYFDNMFLSPNKLTIISYWDLFYLGYILFKNQIKNISGYRFVGVLSANFLAIFLHHFQTPDHWIFYVAVITTVIILYIKYQPNFTRFISKISYSLYLTHGFTGGLILYFSRNIFLELQSRIWLVIAAVIISVIAAWPFYFIVERPCQNISKKLRLNSLNNPPKK